MACPASADGVHHLEGMKCPCGWVMVIPRFCVSFDVSDKDKTLVSDGFNCEDVYMAAGALREAADKLEKMFLDGEILSGEDGVNG